MQLSFSCPALAADLGNGAKVFSANCASCHMGGKNIINASKTLKKMHWQSMEWIR
jgi:cytochrome c6